ncbi:hypothetical protein BO70DRAFT_335252 [Aspergillus heteromorphus CBS 117.55]|uniref:Reverse transcriptase domain-containing protein n=1 Tax=Aspergillus heteromorphus CBS 117.55 TaxID=1448321 RepID=A0A317WJ35_9EURO|nr:uncharacterized protein BO70DRAFT_335252 [Aspergillus heteromorphus CBS 117.55]PWY85078.1 hypothetical protein BO70DRAFT_335252 [Aspergillus heteromorphus CBS 117.55]
MAPTVSALSQTLQSLTLSKIRELEKRRKSYDMRKVAILEAADASQDPWQRLQYLLKGTLELYPAAATDSTVVNIERWIHQSTYDSSIAPKILAEFETELRTKLDVQSRKLALADLYSRLLTEWVDPPSGRQEGSSTPVEDDYMVVDERQKQRLQQLCDQFDESVFQPLETDEAQIRTFLDGLFPDDESKKALQELRKEIESKASSLWCEKEPFSADSVADCIHGLLNQDLLSEEKRVIMKSFLKTPVALTEIADVLNMRYGDIEGWDWNAGIEGIPVIPRQQANGKYRIWMDDDLLQLIFVQYIGTRLCNLLKASLTQFIRSESVWSWACGPQMTERDRLRNEYYTTGSDENSTAERLRKEEYLDTYFLSQLPKSETTLGEDGNSYDEGADDEGHPMIDEQKNFRQLLLRKIATEALLHRHMHGAAVVIQSDMKWYATCLPHGTIIAVMKYVGFPPEWIGFYHRYLAAPLNMDDSCEGREPIGPRIRKRGIPFSHASEKLLGEMILFFMDLTVNRATGMLLYRLHDDLWLCGEPSKCVRAWDVMHQYARVTGLEFNHSKTGSAYLAGSRDPHIAAELPKGSVTFGFLKLDADTETWVIDEEPVEAHVQQLRQQLERCDSVISWVRTWNSCIGRFFKNTFGQPAYCFGEPHVHAILTTYKNIQRTIFGNPETGGISIQHHLRAMITSRFGEIDIPDAFFFFPEQLGGLGLRNPVISVCLVERTMSGPPFKKIQEFFEQERTLYDSAKKAFDILSDKQRRQRREGYAADDELEQPLINANEANTFMSFAEFTRFRESRSPEFSKLYTALMQLPLSKGIRRTRQVDDALRHALNQQQIRGLSGEERWSLELYVGEVVRTLGGVNLVDQKFLPVGVLGMVKEKPVKWQMVL